MAESVDLDALPFGALVVRDGVVVGSSKTACSLLGHDPVGLVVPVGPVVAEPAEPADPADVEPASPPLARLLGEALVADREVGAWIDGVYLVASAGGRARGAAVVQLRDGTEDRRHRSIVNRIVDGAMVVSPQGTLLWRSDNMRYWTQLRDDEALGAQNLARLHPEDIPEALRLLGEAVEHPGRRVQMRARSRAAADQDYWEHLTLSGVATFDEPGLEGVLVGVQLDQTGLRADDTLGRTLGVSVAELAPIGIVLCTRDGETVYGNPAARRLLGDAFDPLLDMSWVDVIDHDARPRAQEAIKAAVAGAAPGPFTVRPVGQPDRWLRVLVQAHGTDDGAETVVCTLEDIGSEVAARAEAQRLSLLFDASDDLVAAFDAPGRMIWANRALQVLIDRTGAPDGTTGLARLLGPDADRVLAEAIDALTSTTRWEAEVGLHPPDGSPRVMSVIGVAERSVDGEVYSLMIARDITRLKEVEEELRIRATFDALTGLANRGVFEVELTRALARRDADGGGVGLLFADLDGFKAVNDTHGHDVGDRVLRLVADRLRSVVRPEDLVARLGGDEFAVLVLDPEAPTLADLAARVEAAVAAPAEGLPPIGVSVGFESFDRGQGVEPAEALRRVDEAMYAAKGRRR